MSNTRRNHGIAWLGVARVCGWVAVVLLTACQAQNQGSDSGLTRCDASGAHAGCPCDGTVPTICGLPGGVDLLCTGGAWVLAADVCGELDVGIHPTDAGPDANDVCSDEGAFTCGSSGGVVCCGGHLRGFLDQPCGPFVADAATVDAGVDASVCGPNRLAEGCPCDATTDAGAAPCIAFTVGVCTDGTWHRSNHACNLC